MGPRRGAPGSIAAVFTDTVPHDRRLWFFGEGNSNAQWKLGRRY